MKVHFLNDTTSGEQVEFRELSICETFVLPEAPDVVYMRWSLLNAIRLSGPNASDILLEMEAEQQVIAKLFDLKEVEY